MRQADSVASTDSNDEVGELIPIAERHVQDRSVSLLTQRSTVETVLSNVEAPFQGINFDNLEYNISAEALIALRDGCELDYFTENCPEDVLPILQEAAIAPVGCIRAKDVDVLQAFGRETMLTRHLNTASDPNWKQNWENLIAERSHDSSKNLIVGWEETVTLGAYVVYLKNLANKDHGDLIQLLLQKTGSGAAPKSAWGYDSVRAVINYHWQHWAKRLLLITFILFLIWTSTFAVYLVIYIDSPLFRSCNYLPGCPEGCVAAPECRPKNETIPECPAGCVPLPECLPNDATAVECPEGCVAASDCPEGCVAASDCPEGCVAARASTPAPVGDLSTNNEPASPSIPAPFEPHRRLASTQAHLAREVNSNRGRSRSGQQQKSSGSSGEKPACTGMPEHRIPGSFSTNHLHAKATRALSIVSFAVMCPFAIEEYYTMFTQGLEWICVANLIDFSTHSIQSLIFVCHLIDFGLADEWFALLLAVQTVLLSVRVLRFFRLLGEGSTFLDTAVAVIYDVRYWIGYIILTGIAASLSLGVLYKPNTDFQEEPANKEFRSAMSSLVTTFQIIFGTFDMKYIFEAGDYEWVMFIFFFGFQVLMTITVLNLLIAAMSEAYTKVAADKATRMHQARAQVIAEFETFKLPGWIKRKPRKYIHFLVVEKKATSQLSPSASFTTMASRKYNDSTAETVDELKGEVRNMQVKLDELMKLMRNSTQPAPPISHPQRNAN